MCAEPSRSSSRASFSARSSPRRACISLALALSLSLMTATLSAQPPSPPSPMPTTPTLSELRTLSAQLVQRLEARKLELASLQSSLTDYAAKVDNLSVQVSTLQADLTATSTSLDNSTAAYQKLLADFEAYQAEAARALAATERERDVALIAAKSSGLCFKISLSCLALAGLYESGRALSLWK